MDAVLQKSYPESGSSLALNTIEAFPQDLEFSSDGSKFFITGDAMDKVQEFTLSTPYDLSQTSRMKVAMILVTNLLKLEMYHLVLMDLKCF